MCICDPTIRQNIADYLEVEVGTIVVTSIRQSCLFTAYKVTDLEGVLIIMLILDNSDKSVVRVYTGKATC